ncbi:MAG: hypothetical protein C6W55_16830 [Thermobacillus sp.]|uniref:Uncharacterized protein n=1 Tax=Thermobacillus composti (strain DSM 18247 / JCM 13945 / KWC4) TaxID=717605 RepID=L0EHJ1_THECK|nr:MULTISPECIES: hypothetical protein [Thermobacillus]AGA59161.1 hypothetical protein Theco_3103 [Thermobacillus composti KWC4]REK52333.1 MAG: hypothetical protein C6W55_16830 [Thermobacillus sp.]
MDYQKMTLDELKDDLIRVARGGYPVFIAGALYWLAMGVLGLIIEGKTLALCYLLGVGSIFPLGLLLGRLLKADLMSRNPLGALSGIVGGIQAFFLPLWIVIYIEHFELIPFAIGLLAGSHFLPYIWIYRSRTYLFLTLSMAAASFFLGYIFDQLAFSVLPFVLTAIYLATAAGLAAESRQAAQQPS